MPVIARTPLTAPPPDWSFVSDPQSYDHWWTFAKRALDNISRMDPLGIDPTMGALTAPAVGGHVVVSTFDGISGLAQAMKQSGVPITKYVASEISKPSMLISGARHPEIVQMGAIEELARDASRLPQRPDLFCAGFPCKDLSISKALGGDRQVEGLAGARSGLFYDAKRVMDRLNPLWWLFENVGRMRPEEAARISSELGVQPLLLDAADYLPAARQRQYWTNLPFEQASLAERMPGAAQTMKDIIEIPRPPGTMHSAAGARVAAEEFLGTPRYQKVGMGDYDPTKKLRTIKGVLKKGSPSNVLRMPDGSFTMITPEEAELALGYPRGYSAVPGVSKTSRFESLGESFAVPVIADIIKSLRERGAEWGRSAAQAMGQGTLW